jgi:hypothetical protein
MNKRTKYIIPLLVVVMLFGMYTSVQAFNVFSPFTTFARYVAERIVGPAKGTQETELQTQPVLKYINDENSKRLTNREREIREIEYLVSLIAKNKQQNYVFKQGIIKNKISYIDGYVKLDSETNDGLLDNENVKI